MPGSGIFSPLIMASYVFKVLLKELQSLGLDVRVLQEDGSEVELTENIDYGDTDIRSILEGDSREYSQNESFEKMGYQKQEFKEDGELTSVESESFSDDYTDDYENDQDDSYSDDEE